MKPFCSGPRSDVRLIQNIQNSEVPDEVVNPFYFPESLAPLVASRKHRKRILIADVLERISSISEECDYLLVEGAGGLLAPLGEHYTALDIIRELRCGVLVVARNRLGTLNHTLLTVKALESVAHGGFTVVLSDERLPDDSAETNLLTLQELLAPAEVLTLPYLGKRATQLMGVRKNQKKVKKVLAPILGSAIFGVVRSDSTRMLKTSNKTC